MDKGRLESFVYGEGIVYDEIKKLKVDKSKFKVSMVIKKGELYFAFNKSIPDSVVSVYQEALKKVLSDKVFMTKLISKYK